MYRISVINTATRFCFNSLIFWVTVAGATLDGEPT